MLMGTLSGFLNLFDFVLLLAADPRRIRDLKNLNKKI
jgi:hypothetical protein